jgi:hypothetical protein
VWQPSPSVPSGGQTSGRRGAQNATYGAEYTIEGYQSIASTRTCARVQAGSGAPGYAARRPRSGNPSTYQTANRLLSGVAGRTRVKDNARPLPSKLRERSLCEISRRDQLEARAGLDWLSFYVSGVHRSPCHTANLASGPMALRASSTYLGSTSTPMP